MGRQRTSRRRTSKNKQYKKAADTKNRSRDIDQIQDDLKVEAVLGKTLLEIDEDLPGLGQFYCTPCARYFHDETTLSNHLLTKDHKRRLRTVSEEQYTQAEADLAAGKTREVLAPVNLLRRPVS